MTEFLTHALEIKAGGDEGTFEGYASIFGETDNDGDIVRAGAFIASLKSRAPALLWQHNPKEPIGRFDEVREDERGLYVKGRLALTGKGAEAWSLLKLGAMNGLSIGFRAVEATRDAVTGVRTIGKADLMEISLVTFPANELARVASVKADGMFSDISPPLTSKDFERFLRDAGFSRSEARRITAAGFTQHKNLRDAGIELSQKLPDDIRQRAHNLTKIMET